MRKKEKKLGRAPVRKWGGFIFRSAEISDISQIIELEKKVWGEGAAASKEQIEARINTFPKGNVIALIDGCVAAYVSIEYIDDLKNEKFNWSEITDNGFIKKSHKYSGEYIYGVNLSVHNSMNGKKLGNRMIFFGLLIAIEDNIKGGFIGSRLPGFAAYKKRYPEISAEEYINLRRNGRRRDYELSVYESEGYEILGVLPNYFPDPASLNYGVLIFLKNPFYGWPLRKIIANLLWKIKKGG